MGIEQTEPRPYDSGWVLDYNRPVQVSEDVKVIDYTKINDDSSFFIYGVNNLGE